MCGIAGFISNSNESTSRRMELAVEMGDAIMHRGPDDYGIWMEGEYGVTFVHRRLSIVDLSEAGHQPMMSSSGRYVIVFNGEIYNHNQIREELERCGFRINWRGHSDTETILAAIDCLGLLPALRKAVGMFAFSLWDSHEKQVILVRDRIGEKPLYYGTQAKGGKLHFLFGSELKAIAAHPSFEQEIRQESIELQMRYGYIPAPYSIYKKIFKVLPGCIVRINLKNRNNNFEVCEPEQYWSMIQVAESGRKYPFIGSTEDAVFEFERLLKQSVSGQMMSDVPLGAFLSGGIDSTTIVALLNSLSSDKVHSFSIGFKEAAYNEAPHAKKIANYLGTHHTEEYISPQEVMNVVPLIPTLYDEPFSDSSQIPTYLVSKLASSSVTVALTGDAGDELLGGYSRYGETLHDFQLLRKIPVSIRKLIFQYLGTPDLFKFDLLRRHKKLIPFLAKISRFAEKQQFNHLDILYRHNISYWSNTNPLFLSREVHHQQSDSFIDLMNTGLDDFSSMLMTDTLTYLPDDILVKVDRASMANSLETRVPLLDHRLIEFVWSLPLSLKTGSHGGKWLLKQVLYKYVPPALVDRPKMGFGVPIGEWIKNPMREWAESLLDEQKIRQEGIFNFDEIQKKWREHLAGIRDWQSPLWAILMYLAWKEHHSK